MKNTFFRFLIVFSLLVVLAFSGLAAANFELNCPIVQTNQDVKCNLIATELSEGLSGFSFTLTSPEIVQDVSYPDNFATLNTPPNYGAFLINGNVDVGNQLAEITLKPSTNPISVQLLPLIIKNSTGGNYDSSEIIFPSSKTIAINNGGDKVNTLLDDLLQKIEIILLSDASQIKKITDIAAALKVYYVAVEI